MKYESMLLTQQSFQKKYISIHNKKNGSNVLKPSKIKGCRG